MCTSLSRTSTILDWEPHSREMDALRFARFPSITGPTETEKKKKKKKKKKQINRNNRKWKNKRERIEKKEKK